MGTSKSYGGPGDSPPLLPDWAMGGDRPAPSPPVPPQPNDPPTIPPDDEPQVELQFPAEGPPLPTPAPLPPVAQPWRSAKIAMGNYARSGGDRTVLQRAGQKYVRARGGSRAASQSSAAGHRATARLGGFLSDVASRGVVEATRSLGIVVIGQPIEAVLAAIADALAPDGATIDEAAARRTIDNTLLSIFERFEVEERGIERLNAMDRPAIEEAFRMSTAEFIFQRLMSDLGKRVEERSISPDQAARVEADVKAYIVECTKLDLQSRDVLSTDWTAPDNQRVINEIYRDAYRVMEAGL